VLENGQVYTRQDLRERFGIADKTLDTGIFKPRDYDSVWLFVTEEKQEGMTDYKDRLEGDSLYWQGQIAGLKDSLIIEHESDGLELVLFHRPSKDAYPGYGFRFEGPFRYISHSGSGPANFVLRRVGADAPQEDTYVIDPTAAEASASACLIDVLAQLRQSGRDAVVAEGTLTRVQKRMHVPDAIENWVAERIEQWRDAGRPTPLLVVLSGNAGDGKSDLIERLRARPEFAGHDLDVIADATHADSPSESQAKRLISAFSMFETTQPEPGKEPRCVLIAMNVGMVIAFFSALRGSDVPRFAALQEVLEGSLGLGPGSSEPPGHWQCEVINLDHRNLLGRGNDGLVAGMLRKLDPEDPNSLVHEAAVSCAACPARGSCWVRTNLNLLRTAAVQAAVHELLWEATLASGLHLTPRNVWDLLFQVTTGGLEIEGGEDREPTFLSCDWIRDHLPASAQELNARELALVHRRLLYHLFFEPPRNGTPVRGPILGALAEADPIRRGGKHTHLAEGEVRAAPRADSETLSTLAQQADEPGKPGHRRPDPLLDGLASLATDPVVWHEDDNRNLQDLALGISRRARLTGLPSEVHAEVTDPDVRRFLELLNEYASWQPGGKPPAAVNSFWLTSLVGGVRRVFGVEVQGKTYFRLDTLSPATRFPAYVPVELKDRLSIDPDPVISSGAEWLDAVAYLPRTVTATIDAGGDQPWQIPVDLQLYRLFSYVNRGYSASSVDLETFFRLRYACERLGSADATGEIVFRALRSGELFRLRREQQLAGWETVFSRLDA
jgi:hypothetical protein